MTRQPPIKARMKIIFFAVFILIFLALGDSLPSGEEGDLEITSQSSIASVFSGQIEDIVDYWAHIPDEEEAEKIADRLLQIPEHIDAILNSQNIPEIKEIREMADYYHQKYRELEILQWSLVQLYETQTITLLPGEAITLTFEAYCLNSRKAGPAAEEFYQIDRISPSHSEWLTPVLDYTAAHPDQEFPVQGLIWNMGNNIKYEDLPQDQQELLLAAMPDANQRYSRDRGIKNKIINRVFGRLKKKVDTVISVVDGIHAVAAIAEAISSRKSELTLVRPQHDIYQLDDGMLVRADSTGRFDSLTLTIANPRSNQEKSSMVIELFPLLKPTVGADFDALRPQNKIKTWKERWDKAKNAYDKAKKAKEALDSLEKGVDGVSDYVKGRGFDEGLDIFKGLNKGNSKAEQAIEIFRDFNKKLLDDEQNKNSRPNNTKFKGFKPSGFQYNPGRGDVQPLAIGR